ncbi:hypothetical protein GQ457_02G043520 [Hibiscus cannabinus]
MSCNHELGIPRIIAIKIFIFTGIQGSFAYGAIDTKQSMIASEKASPTSKKKSFNSSLSIRAQGEWKSLFSTTVYLFRLTENRTSSDLAPSHSDGQITRISTLGFEGSRALVEGTNQTQRRLIRV